MAFDELSPILPIDCFAYSISLPYSEKNGYKSLPNLSPLSVEKGFAEVLGYWNAKGLFFLVEVDQPFQEARLPRYQDGDAFELMIDTRDLKTAGFLTRFCHHFVFLPQPVEGVQAQEVTHFRTEDRHELCGPTDLKIETNLGRRSYSLKIFVPSQCLHGYDPKTFKRLGLTYVVHRFGGESQHFSLS
jgi:hypothetical protein